MAGELGYHAFSWVDSDTTAPYYWLGGTGDTLSFVDVDFGSDAETDIGGGVASTRKGFESLTCDTDGCD